MLVSNVNIPDPKKRAHHRLAHSHISTILGHYGHGYGYVYLCVCARVRACACAYIVSDVFCALFSILNAAPSLC
jgi:hypothetical protein